VATGSPPRTPVAGAAEEGPGGQRPLTNLEALIPPQCYTRTEGRFNPCYVCHQDPIEGDGHENRMGDGPLQGKYEFSDFATTNHWRNLFIDRSRRVAELSDAAILHYVAHDNYTPLVQRMKADRRFKGWKPDLTGLQDGADAFDRRGLAKDGSAWVAINYMPMPSTFWPTNGSTDDVMIRLPPEFRTASAGGADVPDVYAANLAILEAAIKDLPEVTSPPIDERKVGVDLNGDGKLTVVHRIRRPGKYVGAAAVVDAQTFLYPRGTEFLHTVRYLAVDGKGRIQPSRRMKEVRYMIKHKLIPKFALAGLYDNEVQEKIEGNPPYYADFRDRGIDNGFGWRLQGYIEDARGALRPNRYEETLFCMGCHSTLGATIDKTFSFARKVDGAAGWGYINLRGMPDAPAHGEREGQILTYLRRVGGGSEFRANDEMQRRWFRADGAIDEGKVKAAPDVYALLAPSRERALLLNKAYRVIVMEQSFLHGRDPTVTPPEHVFERIDREVPPLAREHRYRWDIRVDWPGAVRPQRSSARTAAVLAGRTTSD
jgi:hypothetical protein